MAYDAIKSNIITEYLKKYPKTPLLTLAKAIYKKNSSVFKNVDSVRTCLRYRCGSQGTDNKKYKKFNAPGKLNPFRLIPEGLTDFVDWTPYNVKCTKALLLSDVHIPYHNKEALEVALEHGQNEGIDCIIFMGDFCDHYSLSRWQNDPRRRKFKDEIQATIDILKTIRAALPNIDIIWQYGNHEERYDIFMEVKAPELLDIPEFNFSHIYHLNEYKINVVSDKRIIKIGSLNVIHGHEFGRSMTNPVNPARGLFLRGKENAVCGHYHQSSNHSENTMNDNFIGCWSLGCLCDMHPKYLPLNKWNLGFGMVEYFGGKEFQMHNKKILNNKVYSV